MGTKKGKRNVRKIEVPTDTATEFELGDTAVDRENREQREEEAEKQQRGDREKQEARRAETLQSQLEVPVA